MVTVNNKTANNTGTATFELMGLSTDTKPTGTFSGYNVGVNSVYLELDTGKLYYFKGSEWEEMSKSGGGGETITVDDTLKADSQNPVQNMVITAALQKYDEDYRVVLTESDGVITTTDGKTIADIESAARALKNVYAILDDGTGILRMPLVYAMNGLVQFGFVNLDSDGAAWSALPSGILGKVEDGEDTWTPVGG